MAYRKTLSVLHTTWHPKPVSEKCLQQEVALAYLKIKQWPGGTEMNNEKFNS